MAKNPSLNRIHQRAWYARTRRDPERWRAFLEKRRAYKQARRNTEQTASFPKAQPKASRNAAESPPASDITWASLFGAIVTGLEAEASISPEPERSSHPSGRH
jgi:hypothetical protein